MKDTPSTHHGALEQHMAARAVARQKEAVTEHISAAVDAHIHLIRTFFEEYTPQMERCATVCAQALGNGNKLFFCGNGGSAADAQHIAAEFVGRFVHDRKSLPAIALTTDTSAITAIANDYGYDDIFARQLSGLGQKGDILFGITTSGNSKNILKAFTVAEDMGIETIALVGKSGGKAADRASMPFVARHSETARIQECHIMFLHLLCGMIEQKLGL